jgi:hypothetical protein
VADDESSLCEEPEGLGGVGHLDEDIEEVCVQVCLYNGNSKIQHVVHI